MSSKETSDGIFQIPTWLEDNLSSFEYFRKITLTTSLRKARRGRDSSPSSLLIRYSTHTPEEQHLPFKQTANGDDHPFFIEFESCIVAVHFIDKTHVLIVAVELIWLLFLNILSVNFVPTTNKTLRFKRFKRSYLNHLAVILVKVTLLFCLMCAVQSGHVPFFVVVCLQW